MGRVGTRVGLLAVVGVVVGVGLVVPADATGSPTGETAAGVPAVRAAVDDLPDALAEEPRVAFASGADALATVDMTFQLDLNGSAGYVVETAALDDPVVIASDSSHDGESASTDSGSTGALAPYAFVSTRDTARGPDVYVRLPADTTVDLSESAWETVRVTCDAAQESHPVLSPDQSLVAYATDVSGDWEVVVAPVGERCSGDDAVSPAPGPGSDELWPAWSPSGRSIFFSSTRDDPLGDVHAIRLERQGGTTARAAGAVSTPAVVPEGPVERLTDDPAADTMPTVLSDEEGGLLVLFTTTRFRSEGSVATFSLSYLWEPDSEGDESLPAVSDPWCLGVQEPDIGCGDLVADVPAVGSEPAARRVVLDDQGDGVLLAYTTTDEASGLPSVWIALLGDRWDGSLEVESAWQVPSDVAVSHPDWASVRALQGGWDGGTGEEETVPGGARLRLTQRSESRVVADAPVTGSASSSGGQGVRMLIDDPEAGSQLDDADPSYAPDGTRVVFSAEHADSELGYRDLDVVDVTTGDVSTLVSGAEPPFDMEHPDWSPDGSQVVFSGDMPEVDATGIWLAEVDDGARIELPDPGAMFEQVPRDPSWSPDGSRIVAQAELGYEDGVFLGVLDPSSRTWTPLTMEVVEPGCVRYEEQSVCDDLALWLRGRQPSWSPDGTRIAVADLVLVGSESHVDFDPIGYELDLAPDGISVLDVEPGDLEDTDPENDATTVVGLRAVTGFDQSAQVPPTQQPDVVPTPDPSEPEPEPEPEPETIATPSRARVAWSDGPAWTPDGTEILFSGQPAGRPDDRDIYAVAPDGTGLRVVVDSPAALTDPDVQPVGDLALTLAADPGRLDVATTSTLTATVTNDGTIPATSTVVLVLPPGLRSGDLPEGCGAEPGAEVGSTVVTCPSTRPLAPGAELTTTVPVITQTAGSYTVEGAVTNPGAEEDVANNVAEVAVQVDGPPVPPPPPPGGDAALDVDVAVSAERAWVGGHGVDVTVTVRNTGDATATDLVLVSTYPPGTEPSDVVDLTPVDATVPDGPSATEDCLGAWGTCPLADLAPGAVVEITSTLDPVGPAGTDPVAASVTGRTAAATSFGGLVEGLSGPGTSGLAGPADPTGLAGPDDPAEPVEPLTGKGSVEVEVVQPWLRILPDVAAPGDVVLVYGEDFPPGEDAMLTWSAGITTAPGPYPVNEDGRLSIPVLVVRNDLRGSRWLRVTSGPTAAPMTTPRVVDASMSDLAADPDAEPVPLCPEPPTPATDPVEPSGVAWCEVDGATLVVTPTVAVTETLERR